MKSLKIILFIYLFKLGNSQESEVEEAVAKYLADKYGNVDVEIIEVYKYASGLVEVSGTVRIREEKLKRRFTVKLNPKEMKIIAFGIR